MRIVFMGNPVFAIQTLKRILASNHQVVSVVSNSPKRIGRGQQLLHTPVGSYAIENNLNLIAVDDIKSDSFIAKLKELDPDIFVVVAYRILPDSIINIAPNGAINLHASLLPKYRGAAPIQWALINGEIVTGVSIFQITSKVDAGGILKQVEVIILPDDNYLSLSIRLSKAGADLIVDSLNEFALGIIKEKKQDSSKASWAPKILKKHMVIDWSWPALKIHNWVRALSPYPAMTTTIKGKQLRIYKTSALENSENIKPGIIVYKSKEELQVSTGLGSIALVEIQLEGKKKMTIKSFMNGFEIEKGDIIG